MLDDLLIFSVWMFVCVASLVAGREGRHPSFTVLGWAAIAGFVGLVGGFIEAMHRDGSYIGNANFAAWEVGTSCAGIGWAVAAIMGLIVTRHARPVSGGEARVLGIGAVLSVLAAVAVTHRYFAPDSWGEDVGVLSSSDPTLALLYRLVWLDGLIVAAICLALILRNRRVRMRHALASVSAVAVVLMLVVFLDAHRSLIATVPTTEVPNVTGSTLADAKAILYRDRLGVSKSVRGVIPNWIVTGQDPAAGNEVEVDSTVHLTVAVEPEGAT
jgi:hypothetical protein